MCMMCPTFYLACFYYRLEQIACKAFSHESCWAILKSLAKVAQNWSANWCRLVIVALCLVNMVRWAQGGYGW